MAEVVRYYPSDAHLGERVRFVGWGDDDDAFGVMRTPAQRTTGPRMVLGDLEPQMPPVTGYGTRFTQQFYDAAQAPQRSAAMEALGYDPRVTRALPPGYYYGEQGGVYRRRYTGRDPNTGKAMYSTEMVSDPEQDQSVANYRESVARRILQQQRGNMIRQAKATTKRRAITPQEFWMASAAAGMGPRNLDAYIPVFGMEAARQQTGREYLRQMAPVEAAMAGDVLDRNRAQWDMDVIRAAIEERNARLRAFQEAANAMMRPQPPYVPPMYPITGQPSAEGYNAALAAQMAEEERRRQWEEQQRAMR